MKKSKGMVFFVKPLVDLEENCRLRLENYREILDLSETQIRVAAGMLIYDISGEVLRIKAVSAREIFVEGQIREIRMKERGQAAQT